MPKNKTHKGLLKRIRITATGKIKFRRAGGRHRRSHKSGDLLRSYRQGSYAGPAEAKRISALLFGFGAKKRRRKKEASAETAAKPATTEK